jgi:hypothetical protein
MTNHEIGEEIGKEIARGIAQKIAIGIAFFFAFIFFIIFGGFVVQWLWNWLVPDLFGLRRLTIWEALGLLTLSRILFGGWGRGGGAQHRSGRGEWWKTKRHHRGSETTPPATGQPAN